MRAFAEVWGDGQIVQRLAGQLPWFHNVALITRPKDDPTRAPGARKAIAGGWSRATLELNIRNRLHEREGQAVNNLGARLRAPHRQAEEVPSQEPGDAE